MASKTHVAGNRVSIDDTTYVIKPGGTDKYTVFDDFGGKLGVFVLRGKAVEPEDYGVDGAHPVAVIAKLWAAANVAKAGDAGGALASKMVCRVVTHERAAEADLQKARAHRAWLKKQPGVKAAYLVTDPATGKTLSISVWETREMLTASRDLAPPEGAVALKATSTESYQLVEDP